MLKSFQTLILRISSCPRPGLRAMIVFACAIIGIISSLYFSNNMALHISLFLIFCLMLSAIYCQVNFKKLTIHYDVQDRGFAGHNFFIRIFIGNKKKHLDSFSIELENELLGNGKFYDHVNSIVHAQSAEPVLVDSIPAGENVSLEFNTSMRKRGIYNSFQERFHSGFPLNFFEKQYMNRHEKEIVVYPKPLFPTLVDDKLSQGLYDGNLHSSAQKGSDGEFGGLREFQYQDSMNRIHWGLSEHFQELVVKEFEFFNPDQYTVVFHSYQPLGTYVLGNSEHLLELLSGIFLLLFSRSSDFNFIASFNNWELFEVHDGMTLEDALETLARADILAIDDLSILVKTLEDMDLGQSELLIVSDTPKDAYGDFLEQFPQAKFINSKSNVTQRPRFLNKMEEIINV